MKKVDCVIKLGGSILYNMSSAKKLLDYLDENEKSNLVFTIGSGYLGEVYKEFVITQNGLTIPFANSVVDWANIQSINASILATLSPNYVVCNDPEEVYAALENGKRPIADARGFLDTYKKDINQKSDVRSAHICSKLNCKNLIVVTDVPGIYEEDPRKKPGAHIISLIDAQKLKSMGRTSVDEGLAEKIIEFDLKCYVLGIDNLIINKGMLNEITISTGTVIRGRVYE